jgi:3-methyladenine DNA glycosylase AlkD
MSVGRLISALEERLETLATERSRAFWEGYLKGVVPFRGVPMAAIRAAVHAWWREDGPSGLSLVDAKSLALALFDGRFGEDRLAGTIALQELLLASLGLGDLETFAALFERERIADWNSCDWFCVRVLGPLVARELPSPATAEAIAAWRDARTVWQRRAANVAFVNLARHGDRNFPGFTSLMLETCGVTVRSGERFAQTGVGWLLRELAEADRAAVLAFTRDHLPLLSREGLRYILERMPKPEQAPLLEAHRHARAPRPARRAGRSEGGQRGGRGPRTGT